MSADTSSFPQSSGAAALGKARISRRLMNEVLAVACVLLAFVHFIALISYAPSGLPDWVPFSETAEAGMITGKNLLGSYGAVLAGYSYLTFGAAAFMIPAIVLWLGVAELFGLRLMFRLGTITAVVALMVSSASLLELQSVVLQDWEKTHDMPSTQGGLSGYLFGRLFVGSLLGSVGGFMLMAAVYCISLILITGYRFYRLASTYTVGSDSDGPETLPGEPPASSAAKSKDPEMDEDWDDLDDEDRPLPQIQLGPYSYEEEFAGAPPYPFATPFTQLASPEDLEESKPSSWREEEPTVDLDEDEEDEAFEPFCVEQPEFGDDEDADSADDFYEDWDRDPFWEKEDIAPKLEPVIEREEEPKRGPARKTAAVQSAHPAPKKDSYEDTTPIPLGAGGLPFADEEEDTAPKRPTQRHRRPNLYQLPGPDLLDYPEKTELTEEDIEELRATQRRIVDTLASFGVAVRPGEITRGPSVTRYEIYPGEGLRVKQIVNLEADIARATRAQAIHILAPIPGKETVGIEIANDDRVLVPLRDILEKPEFYEESMRIPLALGQDVYGRTVIGDLAGMPHLLVAGATGSGKSVCINSIIASLLYRFTPEQLRLILIDPKIVEMQAFASLPHLAVPVVTNAKQAVTALRWCLIEMDRRYQLLADHGCRKIDEYNAQIETRSRKPNHVQRRPRPIPPKPELSSDHFMPEDALEFREEIQGEEAPELLPYIVVVIDELADLMQAAAQDMERCIVALCQKARAAGIHLVIATQSPRVDVITGTIKANIPARIAFQVVSMTDSRVILDKGGAEKLVGKGDMLYQPGDSPIPIRAQGAFLTDREVDEVAEHCSRQMAPSYQAEICERMESAMDEYGDEVTEEDEAILERCLEVIRQDKRASTSHLQRRLRLGYNRAARMVDILEQRGILGPADGSKPREILIDLGEDIP